MSNNDSQRNLIKQASVALTQSAEKQNKKESSRSILSTDNLTQPGDTTGGITSTKQKLSLAGSRAAQSNADNNIQGSEIARLENRIEAMETNASIMKDLITKEVLEKMASQVKETSTDVTEVLAKLDAQPAVIESSVLERVAEMFTDNIYEIIPGYQELEDNMANLQAEMIEQTGQISQTNDTAAELQESVDKFVEEFQFMKSRFSSQFIQKIEKTLQQISTIQYDVEVIKMNAAQFALKKDLDSVELKLSQYCLKKNFDVLNVKSKDFALFSDLLDMKKDLRTLDMSMDIYAQVSVVNKQFDEQRSSLQIQVDQKVQKAVFENKISSLELATKDHQEGINKKIEDQKSSNDAFAVRLDELKRIQGDILNELESKTSTDEGKKLWANFTKFAVYDDLKDLYQRCVPAISGFEDKLLDFKNDQLKMQQIIRNFDGLICEKASKENLQKLQVHVDSAFVSKADNAELLQVTKDLVDETNDKVEYLENMVKMQSKAVQKELYSAVRKAIAQNAEKDQVAIKFDPEEVTEQMRLMLQSRATTEQVMALEQGKASKVDQELSLRWIDLLHKMVKSIMQIYTMKLKSDIDMTGLESENQRQNRRVELLHQSLVVSKWVDSFNSQNVHDFLNMDKKDTQPEIQHQLNMQFRDALEDIQSIKLSPNLKVLNKHITATKDRLLADKRTRNTFNQRAASMNYNTHSGSQLSMTHRDEAKGSPFGKKHRDSDVAFVQPSTVRNKHNQSAALSSLNFMQTSATQQHGKNSEFKKNNRVVADHHLDTSLTQNTQQHQKQSKDLVKERSQSPNGGKPLKGFGEQTVSKTVMSVKQGTQRSLNQALNLPDIQPFYRNANS